MVDPQRLNLYAYVRNNPLRLTDATGMDVTIGNCPGNMTVQMCFSALQNGLRKEDRSHVHLVEGDGKNGFKKGQYGVTVDKGYTSDSNNFQTLQALSNDHSAMARIDVYNPTDSFQVRVATSWSKDKGSTMTLMSMQPGDPRNNTGFEGFTFFQYRGKDEAGVVYSAGDFTDVVANTVSESMDSLSQTIHHELRHVLLGDFGRSALNGLHGRGNVDAETKSAETEAATNEKEK
jgi:hypothetical protein